MMWNILSSKEFAAALFSTPEFGLSKTHFSQVQAGQTSRQALQRIQRESSPCQNAKRCCAQQKKSRRNHRPVSADAAPFPLNGFLLLFSYAFHKLPTLPQHSAAIRIPESFRTIRNGRQYHDYFLIMCRLFRSISKFRRLLRSRFERIKPENRD